MIGSSTAAGGRGRPTLILVALIFCVAAVAYTIWPLGETYRGWNDFRFVYVAGQNWLQGVSPYDFPVWVANWVALPHDFLSAPPTQPFIYPPHWAALAIPLAALPWSVATRLWDVIDLGAFVGIVILCASMVRRRPWSQPALWLLVGAATASGAVRYALWESQMSMLPTLGVVGAIWAWRRGNWRALAAFAFLAALKPHIALLPLLFLLLNGGLRGVLAGGAVALAVSLAALFPVGLGQVPDQLRHCASLHMAAGFNRPENFTNVAVLWSQGQAAQRWFWAGPTMAMLLVVGMSLVRRQRGSGLAGKLEEPLWVLSLLAACTAAFVPLHGYDLVIFTPIFFLAYRLRPGLAVGLAALLEVATRPHLMESILGIRSPGPWLNLAVVLLCFAVFLIPVRSPALDSPAVIPVPQP